MDREKQKSILLVEDEAVIAAEQQKELQDSGYRVSVITSGEKAVNHMLNGATNYDLILMDINLGRGIDGIEAAEQILKAKDIPVVFLSSHSTAEILNKIDRVTSYGYVLKNTGITVLNASLKMAFKLHKANKTIELEKKNWEKMFNAADQSILVLDPEQNILKVNTTAIEAIGKNSSEIIGQKCYSLFHGTDEPPRECPMQKVLQQLVPQHGDMEVEALGRSFLVSCTPIFSEKGELEQVFHTATDITQRKKDEFQRVILEEAVENLTDAVGMSTPDGYHYFQNKAYDNLYGPVKNGKTEHHYVDSEAYKTIFAAVLNGGKWVGEVKMFNKDRDIIDVFLRAFANKDPEGKILSLVSIHTDISNQKKIERALQKSEEQYKEQSVLLETIFNSIPDIIGIQNTDHSIIRYNKAGYEYLGITQDQIKGQKCYEFIGRNFSCESCATQKVYQKKQPAKIERFFEETGTWLEINAYPILNNEGNITKVIEHIRDITEQKRFQEVITKQLTEKELLLKEVHHRIKNNISSIRSFLSIQAEKTENSEAKDILKKAISRVESMYRMYQNLLISDSYEVISSKEYLEELIRSAVSLFPDAQGIAVETEIEDVSIPVKQMFSIGMITNELVTNSIKYAFTDLTAGVLSISLKENAGVFHMTFTDNGRGLPNSDNSANGFGLTLVKMLAEQLKGTFKLHSNTGVEIHISFPKEW